MLSDLQARTMLSLQAAMNARVDPNWVAARYPYMRAVVIEAAEAIEHHGWKWWKKRPPISNSCLSYVLSRKVFDNLFQTGDQ